MELNPTLNCLFSMMFSLLGYYNISLVYRLCASNGNELSIMKMMNAVSIPAFCVPTGTHPLFAIAVSLLIAYSSLPVTLHVKCFKYFCPTFSSLTACAISNWIVFFYLGGCKTGFVGSLLRVYSMNSLHNW